MKDLEEETRFKKSTTAPTHYVRIYVEMRIVILIRLLTRFEKSTTAPTLYVRIYRDDENSDTDKELSI